ncbi:TetR/AcrR family transcriptional regulator [Brevibacillus ginsengisoli]|uniref:TetR/AcrR family transcriptional regulator n=1 Tax=Brevibacillus ginsengisoli TaxID=363854 RepID=UPI003CF96426
MDQSNERVNKKRAAILTAAKKLLKQYHPNKVSIRDIASEADVSVVTIYNHFQHKEGLIFHIVKQMVEDQIEYTRSVLESAGDFQEKLQILMMNKSKTIADFHPEFFNYMMGQSGLVTYLSEISHSISFPLLQQLIEQGKEEGAIAEDMPISLIMSVFELYSRDMTSRNSILLSNHNIANEYEKIAEILIYGISGKKQEGK